MLINVNISFFLLLIFPRNIHGNRAPPAGSGIGPLTFSLIGIKARGHGGAVLSLSKKTHYLQGFSTVRIFKAFQLQDVHPLAQVWSEISVFTLSENI